MGWDAVVVTATAAATAAGFALPFLPLLAVAALLWWWHRRSVRTTGLAAER